MTWPGSALTRGVGSREAGSRGLVWWVGSGKESWLRKKSRDAYKKESMGLEEGAVVAEAEALSRFGDGVTEAGSEGRGQICLL